ncbi:hypothetical protein LCGC14_2001550 [marine sediment metagenome]|uniref:Uncharacterized protein n=1 Tax=marine sediment metagenome TaxID=412755 RepID=A0A0F9I078_9ZZZZ
MSPYKDKEMKSQRQKERRRGEALNTLKPLSEALNMITGGKKPIYVDTERAAKLLLISKSLDKEVTGLDGRRVNLLSMVRYGIFGPTMSDVKESLS